MSRIGGNLAKMKDNFIVAHLRNRRFAAAVERGDDVSNWREDSEDEMVRSKRAKISGKGGGGGGGDSPRPHTERAFSTDGSLSPRADSVASLGGSSDFEPLSLDAPIGEHNDRTIRAIGSFDFSPVKADHLICEGGGGGITDTRIDIGQRLSIEPSYSEDPGDMTMIMKRSLDEMGMAVSSYRKDLHHHLHPSALVVPDTTDDDSPFESELFESRQQFLNYCQTTYSQFDELRRAKHTSLMILFLVHNPSAPKFVQQCGACYNDITHGIRHHCRQCSNFDLCENCYEPVTSGQWAKKDPRFAHPRDHQFVAVDLEADAGTETRTAAEKMKSLKKHMELLEHAAFCAGAPECSLQNCVKMKGFIKHVARCDIVPKRDCKICKTILSLCTIHARFCSFRGPCCLIPFCDRIRERNNRLKRQQQLMDDRRRQAQNELYHASGEK
jgi:TAZ zinc finger/Zinc finger, ZZ type